MPVTLDAKAPVGDEPRNRETQPKSTRTRCGLFVITQKLGWQMVLSGRAGDFGSISHTRAPKQFGKRGVLITVINSCTFPHEC